MSGNLIYHLDPLTHALQRVGEARVSPLEEGVLLRPADSTFTAPPSSVPAGKLAVCLDGETWTLITDNRGIWYGEDRQAIEMLSPDGDVAGLTRVAPLSDCFDLVDGVWVENTARRLEALQKSLQAAVQKRIDAAAIGLGYDSALSAISYSGEPSVAKFQNEGRAVRAFRSQTWAACHIILEAVVKGERAEPTEAGLLAELPEFEAP